MLRSNRLNGEAIERTVSAVKPSARASAHDPADDCEPDRELCLARRCVAPSQSLLLDLVDDLFDSVSILRIWLLACANRALPAALSSEE